MKILKENQELADLYRQAYPGKSDNIYDRASKLDDNTSNNIIRNNPELLKLKNDPRSELEKSNDRLEKSKDSDIGDSVSGNEMKKRFEREVDGSKEQAF